jgi:hypothetical protein
MKNNIFKAQSSYKNQSFVSAQGDHIDIDDNRATMGPIT